MDCLDSVTWLVWQAIVSGIFCGAPQLPQVSAGFVPFQILSSSSLIGHLTFQRCVVTADLSFGKQTTSVPPPPNPLKTEFLLNNIYKSRKHITSPPQSPTG
jgi:hypothetical protein